MAKRYLNVGSVVKGKDGKPDYIKINVDVALKKGEFVNLESAAGMKKRADELEADGKMTPEAASKMRERADKIPSFVRFNLTVMREVE